MNKFNNTFEHKKGQKDSSGDWGMALGDSLVSIPNMSSAIASAESNEFEIKALRSPNKFSTSFKDQISPLPTNNPPSPMKRPPGGGFPDRIVVNEVRFDTADTKLKP
jgi:hypothetical protein